MRFNKNLMLFLLVFFLHSFSYGQNPHVPSQSADAKSEEKKLLKSARKEFDYGNYVLATENYEQLLKLDSTNPTYNFELAQTLYSNFRQPQAIPFFEKAIKFSKDTISEAYYLLGNAYHLACQFDMALMNYRIYQSMLNIHGTDLTGDEESDLKNEVSRKIEMCDNGKLLYNSPPADKFTINSKTRSFRISELGKDVNSEYDDYSSVLSSNDSVMYFTSRRDGTTGGLSDWDDKLFEDIYVSNLGKNGWEKALNVGTPINTKMHDAVISLSPDGKTLYFYRGLKQGTFYSSTLKGNVWTKPEVFFQDARATSGYSDASFFGYAVSGSELYVVSESDTGTTGRDIYLSKKKSDGSWGPLTNIGAPINTRYNEDAPFITSDGNTMYFSSKGHNSMGGYDIFKSERKGDTWSEPVNLGVPINSPGEDIYFIIGNKGDQAYYSSSSHSSDGTKDMDIYMIDLCDDIPQTILAGVTFGITNGIISVAEKANNQKIGDFKIENSKYSIPLKHGSSYLFTLNVPSVMEPVSFEISAPQMCKVYNLYQEIEFPQSAQSIVIKNAFFDIKKETNPENYSEFLTKIDKNSMPLYSEIKLPIVPAILAKVDTTKTIALSINTATTTPGTVTATTTVADTHTTATTSGITTATTHTTVPASGVTTTVTTAVTHTAVTTSGVTTATTSDTHSVTVSGATTTTTSNTTTSSGVTSSVTTMTVNDILFDYDKSNLRKEFTSELDKVIDFLKNANKKAKIEVIGHTDSKGSNEYNLALSKRRASAVADYLASKGISRSRIITVGDGESKPIAANENPDGSDNPDGRAKNRRTEIVVTQ